VRSAAPVLLAMSALAASRSASAGEGPTDALVACAPDAAARIETAVGSPERPIRWTPIARVDAAAVLRRSDEGSPRLWVDCALPDRLRLTFADRTSERFLVRDVPLAHGLDEIALETIAQVIESSISALDADASTGMTRTQMASSLEPPAAAPPAVAAPAPPAAVPAETAGTPPSSWKGGLGAFYGLEAFGPGPVLQHGPGLLVALAVQRGRRCVGGWASAQYSVPETIETSLISARLDGAVLRAGVELLHDFSERVAVGARAGIGGDVVRVSPRQGSSGVTAQLAPDHVSWITVAQAAVTVKVRMVRGLSLSGTLLADVDLLVRHYDVAVDGAAQRAFTPWPVRPGLTTGVTWP
jgi:hypothetical protein